MKRFLFFISREEIIMWKLFTYKINLKGEKNQNKKIQPKTNSGPW